MFEKVLIANRGEIALRIHRACREMGIKTVAVHSTADANAMNVRLADETVCIGPPPARDSYLNVAGDPVGRDDHRRRRDPSRARLSRRERRFRRGGRGARVHLYRPVARAHPADGQQGARQGGGARGSASRWCRARPGRCATSPPPRRRPRDDRLSGADQGLGRRRRARHEAGARRRRAARAAAAGAGRGAGRRSATIRSISNAISTGRGISRSSCSATARAGSSISASATARCSARTRSCSRKPRRRRSTRRRASG